jgi:hypothetical protein
VVRDLRSSSKTLRLGFMNNGRRSKVLGLMGCAYLYGSGLRKQPQPHKLGNLDSHASSLPLSAFNKSNSLDEGLVRV